MHLEGSQEIVFPGDLGITSKYYSIKVLKISRESPEHNPRISVNIQEFTTKFIALISFFTVEYSRSSQTNPKNKRAS